MNDILYTSLANKLNGAKQVPGRHKKVDGLEHLDKVIHVDQSPIGRTPRSNPATYTGVFDHIRKLFAETNEAKVRGYTPGRFSFNVKGGRCEACSGDGTLKIEMNFCRMFTCLAKPARENAIIAKPSKCITKVRLFLMCLKCRLKKLQNFCGLHPDRSALKHAG